MGYLKKYGTQGAFTFHFVLAVVAMLVLNVCDIMMWRSGGIISDKTETVGVPGTAIELLPYHFWVMGVLWLTMNMIIALTYFFYTRDMLGGVILGSMGIIFSMLAVQDVLFFYFQGRPIPQKWTWLYWQNEVFGTPVPGFTVALMALIGGIAIFMLYFLRMYSLKRQGKVTRR